MMRWRRECLAWIHSHFPPPMKSTDESRVSFENLTTGRKWNYWMIIMMTLLLWKFQASDFVTDGESEDDVEQKRVHWQDPHKFSISSQLNYIYYSSIFIRYSIKERYELDRIFIFIEFASSTNRTQNCSRKKTWENYYREIVARRESFFNETLIFNRLKLIDWIFFLHTLLAHVFIVENIFSLREAKRINSVSKIKVVTLRRTRKLSDGNEEKLWEAEGSSKL